jgi:hypothetical protein
MGPWPPFLPLFFLLLFFLVDDGGLLAFEDADGESEGEGEGSPSPSPCCFILWCGVVEDRSFFHGPALAHSLITLPFHLPACLPAMAEEQEGETDMMGPGGIRVARRRLSVVSDSPTVDGVSLALSHLGVRRGSELSDAPHVVQGDLGSSGHSIRSLAAEANVVSIYSGYSKKGMAPYNPRKKNQDALIMAEDPATNSLLLVVLDGHGEAGDKVAQAFRRELAPAVMAHPSWTTNVKVAIGDCIAKIEEGLLADPSIDTDFSGSTLVCGCIRGSLLTVASE